MFDSEPVEIIPQTLAICEPYANRDQLLEAVLERLAAGTTLTKVCEAPDMPSVSTFFRWIADDDAAWSAYLRARETSAHVFAAQVHDEAFAATDPALGKLRVDALKWTAGKLASKYYGESTQLRHADADGAKLDTTPLVGELLSLMGSGVAAPDAAPSAAAQRHAQVTYREIVSSPEPARQAPVTQHNARPAYRPRVARDEVDDLV